MYALVKWFEIDRDLVIVESINCISADSWYHSVRLTLGSLVVHHLECTSYSGQTHTTLLFPSRTPFLDPGSHLLQSQSTHSRTALSDIK